MGKKPKIVIDPTVITNSQGNGDRTRPVIDPNLVAGVEQGQQQLEIDKYTPYLKSVFLNEGLDEARAKAQTTGDLMKGALGQAASEVVLGTLEGASYMLDFEQHYNHVTGAEKDYTNWFADLMQKSKEAVKEDVAPIYQTKEAQQGVAFGDGTWWASNAPSIASSISLMIPAAGLTRGISALGKAFKLGELGLTAKGLTMATFSRMAENTMEANQTFESTYAKAKQLGFTEDEAKSKAGQAAANTWNANSALWFIDAFQYGTLFRAAKDAGKGVGLLPTLKEMGKTAIAESTEEVYQSVSSKEAEFEATKGTSAGFIARLYKNLQDPETLTAGFFGALGGVAFDVAGRGMTHGERKEDEYRANIKQAVEEGLLKERAQYLGDTVLASKVDDTIFTRMALAHASTNNLDKLKDTLSELKKGDNIDPEVLSKIDKRIEDVNFVDKTIREIKEHSIPTELKDSFLGDKLANRFTANNLELGKKDLENEYQSLVKNGELKTEQLPLKQLHVLKSLGTMAMLTGNKRLAESVAKANEAFKESAGVAYNEKQLKTTVDDKLVEKTAALELLQHKQELLKGRLQKYASPEGVQELISESKAKETQKKVDDTVKKEGVTKEELLNLKKEPLTPEAAASVDARLNELAVEKQAGNKAAVEDVTGVKLPSTEDVESDIASLKPSPEPSPEPTTTLFDDNGNINAEYELHPEAQFDPADHTHITNLKPEEVISPEPSPQELLGLGESIKKKLDKTVKEETKKTKPAPRQDESVAKVRSGKSFLSAQYVRTWGAELLRKWVGKEQKYILTPKGYFTEQTYWKKGEEVKASDVFLTDKNGVLVVNTPLVKAGQSVLLKIENDSFVINKNFKPDSTKNNIVNVYWLDENGKQIGDKPLLQLPSADNPALDSEQQAKNMELRKALETNGSLTRVIQEKSIGQRKISVNKTTKNGLSILEWDYLQDEFQQIPGGAILGYVGTGDKFIFNGARNRANLPNEVIQQLDLIQHDYSTPISNLNGAVLVARMSPNGNYRVESLDTRKLNEAEVAYVANLIKEKKWSDAQKIVYISNPMKEALLKADEKKTNDILSNALRQVDFKLVHTLQTYTDPVTKQEHTSYYDFLKGVLTTTLQGSNSLAKGFDNSYSYVMSTIYLDPHPTDIEVKVDPVTEKVEIKQAPVEVKKEGKASTSNEAKRADIERRRQEELEATKQIGENKLKEGRETTKKIVESLKQRYPASSVKGIIIRILEKLIDFNKYSTIVDSEYINGRNASGQATWFGMMISKETLDGILAGKEHEVHTFIHEFIHGFTTNKISDYNISKQGLVPGFKSQLTQREINAIEQLQRIFNKVKKDNPDSKEYGFTNLDEFIAEAFSNTGFQYTLKSTKAEGKKSSLFTDFINAIGDLLFEQLERWAKRHNKEIPNRETITGILEDVLAWTEELIDPNNKLSYIGTNEEINAKYDAELAALGSKKEVSVPAKQPGEKESVAERRKRIREQQKNKQVTVEQFNLISEKELQWFKNNFGEEFLEIAKGVDRFMAENGIESFGTYYNSIVTLAEFSPEGTAYHEAGHFVMDPKNKLITRLQREKILDQASKVYKLQRNEKNDKELEERIMESFETYKLSNGRVLPEVSAARSFFSRLLEYIKRFLGFKTPIEKLFDKIDTPNLSWKDRQEIYKNFANIYDPDQIRNKRLPGFVSTKVQNEALLSARTRAMNIAFNMSSKVGDAKDALIKNLPQILEAVKKHYSDMANAILSIPEEERTDKQIEQLMVLHAMGVAPEIEGYEDDKGTWESTEVNGIKEDGFQTKLFQSFTNLGFIVKYNEEQDEIEQQVSKDHIHDMENTLVNPSSSISERVKLLLHSIPTPNINREGKVEGNKKTILDEDLPLDFRQADAMLTLQLADSLNPYQRLQNLSETNPIAKAFLDKLNATRAAGDTQTFNEVMVKYRRDTVDKKTVLIQSEEFYIPAHETPDGQAGKGTKTITKTIDANRQAVFRTIVADWEANARHVNFITPDGEVSEALAGTVTKRFQELLAQKQEQNNARSFDVSTASKKLQDMLKLMGVNPPDGFWKELTNLNPKLGKKVNQENERFQRFTSLVFGTNGVTVENLIKSLEENPFTTSSDNVFKKIARASAPYYETSKTGAYLNENGDLEYPINLPSYNSRINNTLKDKTAATAWRTELERDDFYKGNTFLNLVADDSTRGKVQYFRLSAIRTGDRDAKMHNDRNDIDSLLMRFSVYFNNDNTKIPSNTALIPIGTPADKAKTGLFSLPKTKGVQESTQFLFHVLSNTVDNEIVRIKNIRELQNASRVEGNPVPADIKNYNKGNRFFYVDALNNIPNLTADMSKGEASPEEFADAQRMKDQAIADHIENSYKSFLKYLEANDIIRITYKGSEIAGITNKRIPTDMISGESPYKTVQAFLREYFNNDTAWRIEMSKVFMGDRAFYKSDQDYAKRAYQLETPGYIGYTEEDTKLTRAIFSSHMKDASAGIQSISTILKGQDKEKVERIAELYKNINKTDAQSLATIHGYRKLAKATGQWTSNHEELYQNAWKHGVSVRYAVQNIITNEAEQKRILAILKNTSIQALKPFQYSQQSIQLPNGKVMIVKNQFKDSITVILPELANVHKGYKDMLDYMTANSVDIMSDAEAVKVGSYGVVDMAWDETGKHITPALEEWQKRNVKLEDIIFPQMLPDKKKEEVSGTQFHKLIMGDISDDTIYYVDGKKMTGTKLKEEYNNLWVEKLQAGAKALQSKLGLSANFQFSEDPKEKIAQFKKLQTVLKEQLDQKDLNENYRDTIQLVLNQLSTIDFANPISFPQLARPFEGVFVKLFNKYITNEKSPGYVGVNSADLSTVITSKDMEGTKVEKTDVLGFIRNEKGYIIEAEIGLPIDFVKSVGLKYGEHISPTGRVLWDKLSREQQKALQFIAYRIPTSNKSSMAPVRVAIITPNTLNNTILVPGEMTKQMGLDFDVDKTNLLRRTIDKEGKVEESTDNSLFDLYWSILTSPAHIAAVLNPLTTERLESIADKYRELGILAEGSTAPFYTVQADTAVESKNREEKAKVGIASRAATAHSVLQVMGTQYIGTQGIAIDLERNNPGLALGNHYADDGVTLISENLGEIQQAALDAAKTPLLALFNITKTLMPAAETLALFGYSLDTISDFFMQPIVKEWSKVYNEANEKDWMVTDKLLTKYPNLKAAYEQAIKHRPTISKAALANNLTSTVGDNVQLDAAVLQQLEVLRGLGKLVSNITNVLSLDTLSDTSSVSALITTREKVENATNPENAIHLSPLVFQLDNEHPEVKRIAAFYKYAITEPLTFASQFFPITTTQYNDARAYVMGSLGISSTNEEAINKITQFTHFYKLQAGNLLNTALKITHPLGEKGGHPASRWSFTNPENAITEYFLKFLRKAKQDVNLKNKVYDEKGRIKNAFLASLRVYPGRKEGDMPTLGVVNATDDNNNEVIGAWSDLLNSSSQEIRVLAHDLARYAITTTGFGYTTNSFVDLIPLEFWKQTGLDRIWKETLSKDIDKEGLLVNFVRNKYKTLERFPELYISEAGKSETIAASGRTYLEKDLNSFFIDQKYAKKVNANLPRFVEVGGRLYERASIETQKDKFTIQYRQLQPAGGKNLVEITTDGRFKSQVPAYADISPDPFKTKEDKVTSIKGSKEPVKEVMEKKTVVTKAGIPIKANTSFATFDLGDLVGKTASKDKEDAIRKQIIEHPTEAMAPNGERFLVAFDRVTKAMRNLIENHTPNTVVITHNTVFNLIKLWAQRDMPTVLEMTKDKKFREDYANSKDAPHDAPYQLPGLDIFIVRHGETEDNLAGNFRGPNTPLTNKGRKQAEETGKALKKFKPSEIITSGVPRTMETGQIITAVIQGSQDGGTDKITDCNK